MGNNDNDLPNDYKKIRVHFVFAVKNDGRHKYRLVSDGNLTDVPDFDVYSGVVSLRGIIMVILIAALNDLKVVTTDIGNSYLEVKTEEKVYVREGKEFGKLQGKNLTINKALYGLRISGLRWNERFSDYLRDMGFFTSKEESDIWMRNCNIYYDYISVYVDDLIIV